MSAVAAGLALEARGITKYFGHVTALDDVSFEIAPGEVVALMGDNGAGKSTLVKCLSGAMRPDEGTLSIDGEPVVLESPTHARGLGIETVYQDLALADDLSAAENFFLGREHLLQGQPWRRFGHLDRRRMHREASAHLDRLSINLPDLRAPVREFSGGQRQCVAVARALVWAKKVIFMDEPTAALGVAQTRHVLDLIVRVRESGLAVVVISHSVPEVLEVADRIVVLRLGERVATLDPATCNGDDVVAAITGASTHRGGRSTP
ncbi:MAG TPA: ATP-binding cassette domain-containing protein [Solirubrobacteraceae bacterium]|nr:ATP-binding cassette domain-containing protein [Solirubrobacteraceae bacterium]